MLSLLLLLQANAPQTGTVVNCLGDDILDPDNLNRDQVSQDCDVW